MSLTDRHGPIGLADQGPGRRQIAVRVCLGQAIIPKMADRKQPRQFRGSAHVVAVKVGGDAVVNMIQMRHLHHGMADPFRVTSTGIAGINQHTLAGGRDYQRRATAFRIQPVDIKRT